MTLNLNVPKTHANLIPRITVIGVGGAGGNAVNNMILANLEGVEFLIANTDAQAIQLSMCQRCIQLGRNITQGLGAGSRPDIGRAAAEEALDEILTELDGTNMVFITAGMGGGTGTGGAPVIARAAREAGILTVGVVTKPFHFEGVHRMRMAEAGINELTEHVDTLIVIPNQNLFRVANEKTTFADAFKMADDVLHSGVRGVTDLMVMPGLINLDFADIRSVMTEMGKAMMGTGYAEGENRALVAAEAAISNPLLDDVSMRGARGVLINVTGGPDMTLFEVDETANRIREEVDPDANIIFGSTFDESMSGGMRVSVVATGIDAEAMVSPRPVTLSLVTPREPQPAAVPAQSEAQSEAQSAARSEAKPEPAATPATAVAAAEPAAAAPTAASAATAAEAPRRAIGGGLFSASYAAARAIAEEPEFAAFAEPPVNKPVTATKPEARTFLPPPPVVAEPTLATAQEHAPEAAPRRYAAAAATDGARAPRDSGPALPTFDRKRAQSLFAKMTSGAARALQSAAQAGDVRPAGGASGSGPSAPARPLPPARPAPRAEVEAPPMVRPGGRAAPPSEPKAGGQTRLTGLDPVERQKPSSSEEDLLEIPAFLRRQAN